MKKLIAPLLIIALFIGAASLAYLVSQHYDVYTKKQQASERQAQAQADAATTKRLTVLKTENDNLAKDNQTLRTECLKGATAYAKLPAAAQKLIGGISCGE